jgi:hypothetical protein
MDIKKDDIHKKSLYKGQVSVPARKSYILGDFDASLMGDLLECG